jgi:hypothetical protein
VAVEQSGELIERLKKFGIPERRPDSRGGILPTAGLICRSKAGSMRAVLSSTLEWSPTALEVATRSSCESFSDICSILPGMAETILQSTGAISVTDRIEKRKKERLESLWYLS